MTATRNARRQLQGTVVSTSSAQTIVIAVERTYRHPKYGKFVRRRKKYMAHDAEENANKGDLVDIAATRPLSKRKRWRLVRVVHRSVLSDAPTAAETGAEAVSEPRSEAADGGAE